MSTSMDGNNQVKAKPQGKRKIPMEKITDKNKKQVTFSKRRMGVFKKTAELCALCDAEAAVITFSGAGKLFSFGHPSVDDVVKKHLYGSSTMLLDEKDKRRSIIKQKNNSSNEIIERIQEEKKAQANSSTENCKTMQGDGRFWWDEPIDGLSLEKLEQYRSRLAELRDNVVAKLESNGSSVRGIDLNMAIEPTQ